MYYKKQHDTVVRQSLGHFKLIGFRIGTLASGIALLVFLALYSHSASANEFIVYGLYRALDMGNENETPPKDYYVNMGSKNGLSEGAVLEILRKHSTFDIVNQQIYQDMIYPIARIKVIHVEPTTAVARLDKMLPIEQTPIPTPRGIMVGDLVRTLDSK